MRLMCSNLVASVLCHKSTEYCWNNESGIVQDREPWSESNPISVISPHSYSACAVRMQQCSSVGSPSVWKQHRIND